jgi:hypothetical protein
MEGREGGRKEGGRESFVPLVLPFFHKLVFLQAELLHGSSHDLLLPFQFACDGVVALNLSQPRGLYI